MEKKNSQPEKKPSTKAVDYHRYLVSALIALNVALLLGDLLILFMLPRQTKKVIKLRSEILAQQLQTQSAQKLVTDISATKSQQEKIEKALPNEERLLEVIQFLESLKATSQLKSFSFMSDKPLKDTSGLGFLPLTLAFEGSLPDTMVALTRLEKSPYLFTVDSTRIESPGGISEGTTIQVTLRIYVSEPFAKN